MTDRLGASAGELVAETQRELVETAEAIRSHASLSACAPGTFPMSGCAP
jgi:hypothetical protein